MGLLLVDVRARWRRGWRGALAVVLLTGATGGVAIAAGTAAARTSGAFDRLLAEIDAPDALVVPGCGPALSGCGVPAPDAAGIDVTPLVQQQRRVRALRAVIETPDGRDPNVGPDNPTGCVDTDRGAELLALGPGGPHDQAVPFRLDGSLPAPDSTGIVLTHATAARIDVGIGDALVLRGYCGEGEDEGEDERVPVLLAEPIALTVTGLSVGPIDVEPPGDGFTGEPLYVPGAVVDRVVAAGGQRDAELTAIWYRDDASAAAIAELRASNQMVFDVVGRADSVNGGLADDARLLWVLAAVVGAVGALVVLPIVARHGRDLALDGATVAALGATAAHRRAMEAAYAATVGIASAGVAVAGACVIAPALPRGLGEAVEPGLGPLLDPMVSAIGSAALVGSTLLIAVAAAWHADRRRPARRLRPSAARRAVQALTLAPPEDTGARAGLDLGPAGSAGRPLAGALALAVAIGTVAGSLTFLASLAHLEQTPRLAGWDFDGFADVADDADPAAVAEAVSAIDGVDEATVGTLYPPVILVHPQTGTQVWPFAFAPGRGEIGPVIVEGRAAAGPGEVAIDQRVADDLDLAVGDTLALERPHLANAVAENLGFRGVEVSVPRLSSKPAELTVVGVAVIFVQQSQTAWQVAVTLDGMQQLAAPRDGEVDEALAVVPPELGPELAGEVSSWLTEPIRGELYVRMRESPGLRTAGRLRGVAGLEDAVLVPRDQVLPVVIGLNLTRTHRVPSVLVLVLAAIGGALVVHLVTTRVRTRDRELGVLRSLGFSRGHVVRSALTQGLVETLLAAAVGLVLGTALGRLAWTTYARSLYVVEEAVTPWAGLAFVLASALVMATAAAVVTGWWLGRRPLGAELRAE